MINKTNGVDLCGQRTRGTWGVAVVLILLLLAANTAWGVTIQEIKARGEIIHLGVPYANFVTGSGDGLDVDLMKRFAEHLGVRYRFEQTSWTEVFQDLTGRKVRITNGEVEFLGPAPVRGDVAAHGLTVLDWRKKIIRYSDPTFRTQIWLVAASETPIKPIEPSGDEQTDIERVMGLLDGKQVLGKAGTCLDPSLYPLKQHGAIECHFEGALNELVPAVMKGEYETTLLEIPDVLMALQKWPGRIKVIGPIAPAQYMACAFDPSSDGLRAEFNAFFEKLKRSGEYRSMVKKYYPTVFDYLGEFLDDL